MYCLPLCYIKCCCILYLHRFNKFIFFLVLSIFFFFCSRHFKFSFLMSQELTLTNMNIICSLYCRVMKLRNSVSHTIQLREANDNTQNSFQLYFSYPCYLNFNSTCLIVFIIPTASN